MKVYDKTVLLSSIYSKDRSFIVTTGSNIEPLKESIDLIGLVNPPYLFFSELKEMYQVVCGYRRVKALSALGWNQVPVRIFDSSADEKEIFLFSLYDNLSHRNFNPIEKANAVERLLKFFPQDEVIKNYLHLLGLPPTARILKDAIALIKLDDEIKNGVLRGVIQEKNAIRLSGLTQAERILLFKLFCMLNLSSSKQAEIIESCFDIVRRDKLSIRDVLQDEGIKEILTQEKLTLSQKGDRIRQWLRGKRFPRLTRCEERFTEFRKDLCLPANIQLNPPPFFEGESYHIRIIIKSPEDLIRAADQIKRLAESPRMKVFLEAGQ
jgi:ParB family chromosome partitioning protein